MVGDNEDALKEQLESLEGQLSQLTALLTRDVVDSHSPLVQLQVCWHDCVGRTLQILP